MGQLLRPYPQFNGLTIAGQPVGSSIYHSLQVKIKRRLAAGNFMLAYTYSKLINNGGDSLSGFLETIYGVPSIQNWNNLRGERSVSEYDVPQRLVTSYILDLPFGRGKRFGGSLNGALDKLASGWGVEGISTFQSGLPLALTSNPNSTGSLGGGSRPNSNGQNAALSGPAQMRLNQWFTTTDFSAPPAFTFGNVSRTLPRVRGAGIANWDMSVFKNTHLGGERAPVLQFRAECFNLFNRVQFGPPGTVLGTPQFGVVSSQINQPRLVQAALRVTF